MKVGYFPSIKNLLRSTTIRESQVSSRFKTRTIHRERVEAPVLAIDDHTLKDLEVFQSEGNGKSLFDLFNFVMTQGGHQILRQRMEKPSADAASIRATQESIVFIREHRALFGELSFWIASRVERYLKDPLMFVTQKNRLSFAVGATTLKMFESHHLYRIARGVQFSCLFVQSLRRFLQLMHDNAVTGELAVLCEDMQRIVSDPAFNDVPHGELGGWRYWRTLRLDQTFRIYSRELLQTLLHISYEIDALFSLAEATSHYGYTMPTVLDGATRLEGEGLVHPQVIKAVPNDVSMDQDSRLLFLTGPNMAGKTTYLRSVATALYLGHLGMGVPARRFSFTPLDQLFSSIAISDNVHTGTSYFLAEVLRIKAVASAISEGLKVVAIMDEPFKGTNVKDSVEASLAIIERLEHKNNCLFLFSSHLIELVGMFSASNRILKHHFEAEESEGKLRFDYSLKDGVSSQRLGMRVLTEEGVFELLDQ